MIPWRGKPIFENGLALLSPAAVCGIMVRLPCAPTECEVDLVRNCQNRDGLKPGRRLDTEAGDCLMDR